MKAGYSHTAEGTGFVSQAGLQFTSLSHDESCDRAQLSPGRAEPQISGHLLSKSHGAHADRGVERTGSLLILTHRISSQCCCVPDYLFFPVSAPFQIRIIIPYAVTLLVPQAEI